MSYPYYGAPQTTYGDAGYSGYPAGSYPQQQQQGYGAQPSYPAYPDQSAYAQPAAAAYTAPATNYWDPNAQAYGNYSQAGYGVQQQQYPNYQSYPTAGPSPWSGYVAPNAFRNKKALLIGINYIGHAKGQLRGCINDVRNVYTFLTTYYYYRPENIRVLTDDQQDPSRRPTKANIIAGCRWLVQDNQPGDALFFQFSGHGGQVVDTSGDEDDGYDETILPCDYNTAGQIIDDHLHDYLVKPIVEGARLTSIMDCCHSGTGMDLPYVYKAKGPKMPESDAQKAQKKLIKQYKKAGYKVKVEKDKNKDKGKGKVSKKMQKRAAQMQQILIARGIVVGFSGCMDSQTSADSSFQGQAQGAMTAAFLSVLKAANFQITYDQLLYKMREFMAKGKGQLTQVPQLSYGREPFNLHEYVTM